MEEEEARIAEILLVEDNPGDVRLVREALKDVDVPSRLSVVTDGAEALSFLRKEGEFARVRRPDLILLDLNLPRTDGKEVLAQVKADSDLKLIPVVVLTSSSAPQDIVKSYDLHANCYVIKPFHLDRFIEVVKSIANFWLTVVRLPPGAGND